MSLTECVGYAEKLKLLSRVKGYSANVERAFLGKNLLNLLSCLGKHFPHFSQHVIKEAQDHPNGPGAEEYFALACQEHMKHDEAKKAAQPHAKSKAGSTKPKLKPDVVKKAAQPHAKSKGSTKPKINHMLIRKSLIRRLQALWPADVKVDGVALAEFHLGHSRSEANGETVQYCACQCTRTLKYVLTNSIPFHLLRNAMLAKHFKNVKQKLK